MKSTRLLFVILFLLLLNSSCLIIDVSDSFKNDRITGSGYLITEQRTLPAFNAVEMSTAGKVYITYGTEQEVTVVVDQNIAEFITTSVHNGKLYIGTEHGISLSNYKLIINLTMTDLEKLVTSSSGDIIGKNQFSVDRVGLVTNSSGDICIDLEADRLCTRISSSGDIYLSGSVALHEATISSSGDVYAFNLITATTKISISSSGNAEVYASRLLDVKISSSGDVYFKGYPTIYQSLSSSGKIFDSN